MYGNMQAFIDRFGKLEAARLSNAEDGDNGRPNAEKIDFAFQDASNLIDGYLRGRYQTPVLTPPQDLVRAACYIVRRDLSKTALSYPTEEAETDYNDIIKWLTSVQKGEVVLAVPKAQSYESGGVISFIDRAPVFTNNNF